MMSPRIIVAACALFAVCNAGILPIAHHHPAAAALVAPVASAAIVAPYATSYNAHTVNHAVAQQLISAPQVHAASAPLVHAASPYAAAPYVSAPYVAAPYNLAAPYVASPYTVASPFVASPYTHQASYIL